MTTGRVVLLGATGYTGALVLEALCRRDITPVLAGRNRPALQALADNFGGLEHAHVDVTDSASVAELLHGGDVILTTVGPFERFGNAVAQAAADAGAHYVDSTGEVGFVLNLRRQVDARARETGSIMLPAFGYDYVPGILAGTVAGLEAGIPLRTIDIGYFATGPLWRGLSQGTRTTMRDGLTLPSARWRNHEIVDERTAGEYRRFTVCTQSKNAFLVSGSEVVFLPPAFPGLRTLTVYNGWFPTLARPAAGPTRITAHLTRNMWGRRLVGVLTHPVIGPTGGPGETERARTRTHVVAVASSDDAEVAEVHLSGPSIYNLTAELMAWAAHRLTTTTVDAVGVVSPVEAFGLDVLQDGCAEIGLTRVALTPLDGRPAPSNPTGPARDQCRTTRPTMR